MPIKVLSNLQTAITPSADNDITRKGYVDTGLSGKSATSHTHSSLKNTNTASIESLSAATYLMTQNRILAEFSTTKQYNPDDYVTYQGKVYKCITNHAAGSWNATHFILTTLAEYIQKHLHSVAYLDGIETSMDESTAEDYPDHLPTVGAVYDFVMSGVNAFLGMGVFTKIKNCLTNTIVLEDDTAIYKYSISGATTISFDFSNLSSMTGKAVTFELNLTMPSTAYAVTFPNNVSWLNNEVPSMSTPGKTYMFIFRTLDGGTTILASKEGAY